MSAPDTRPQSGRFAGVAIGLCRTDVVELAALRGQVEAVRGMAASRGLTLPPIGHSVSTPDAMVLSVRPERWLLLTVPVTAGAAATEWQLRCARSAAAIDQSSGFTALYLTGPKTREVLARGCRLDLDPGIFPPGRAAATVMAQVATVLAALPSGMLILTPASTARHLREWLASAARPFGLATRADATVSTLSGHQDS